MTKEYYVEFTFVSDLGRIQDDSCIIPKPIDSNFVNALAKQGYGNNITILNYREAIASDY